MDSLINLSISPAQRNELTAKWLLDDLSLIPTEPGTAMFSWDDEVEKRKLKKLRKAFRRVLDHYGVKFED